MLKNMLSLVGFFFFQFKKVLSQWLREVAKISVHYQHLCTKPCFAHVWRGRGSRPFWKSQKWFLADPGEREVIRGQDWVGRRSTQSTPFKVSRWWKSVSYLSLYHTHLDCRPWHRQPSSLSFNGVAFVTYNIGATYKLCRPTPPPP